MTGGVSLELKHEIEQMLYAEARALDEIRFHDWLDYFSDDLRYWVPIRALLQTRPLGIHNEDELAVAHMDESKEQMVLRVKRLDTGMAWSEVPPSRTRHLVSNIEVHPLADAEGEYTVFSNFCLFQSRQEKTEFLWFGQREDRIRRVDGEWKIFFRKVLLDHASLPRAVSIFF